MGCTDLTDTLVQVFDPWFGLAWSTRITGMTRAHLAPETSGELFVAGTARPGSQPLYDMAFARFNALGQKLWQKQYALGTNLEWVLDAGATASGDVVGTGVSCPTPSGPRVSCTRCASSARTGPSSGRAGCRCP